VVLLPLYDPIQVAEQGAVVDLLSGGRLILGIAPGYRPEEFAGFRQPREFRGARMEECMNVILRAWSQERFSFEGKYYAYKDMQVTPKPVQKPHPPVWIGASIKQGIRRAAKYGVPLLASPRHRLAELREHFAAYRDYASGFQTHCDLVPVMRDVYVAETTRRAEEEARQHILYIHREWYGAWAQWRAYTTDAERRVEGKDEVQFEEVRGRFIIGDPDKVSREIEEYRRALGMNYLIARMQFPGLEHEKALRSTRLFAREVMPRFSP
jgi:alkanesulfonate monooxygenase SsuD/methylene tetrahydromethanopterin reductase-like flavin-dependent oxidoreductase (luciferase family)